jgi:nucleotide-binding universal stress UspA family protein
MTPTQILGTIGALWIVIGVSASIVMGRRGYSPFAWLLLGAILGPLVIPLAVGTVRAAREDPRVLPHSFRESVGGAGTVNLLVGIDGSTHSEGALRAALALLGNRIGRLTLATVIDYNSNSAMSGRLPRDTERLAIEGLEGSAAAIGAIAPDTVLLVGQPAEALMEHAAEDGYEVLVVGRRGHGASNVLLGSTAMRLVEAAGIPVLVV